MNCWTKLIQKEFRKFWSKKYENKHWIAHIRMNLGSKFQLQQTIFEQISKNRMLLVKNRKTEHHHWILHIRISLSINFHLKLTILSFRTKFTQKRVFPVENRTSSWWTTSVAFCVVNVNSTVVFKDFEDLKILISLFWTFWERFSFMLKLYKVFKEHCVNSPV